MKLLWPLAVIDIEASSLDEGGYPVEVGFAVQREPGGAIWSWASLICPAWGWLESGHWSLKAAKVHGISREMLAMQGLPPAEVAAVLNAELSGLAAFCDGLPYDAYWLERLYTASKCEPRFTLSPWPPAGLSAEAESRARACLQRQSSTHRAKPDAERLLQAVLAGANGCV